MADLLHLAIRTVHVLAMGLVLGGAVATWYAARRGSPAALALAARYEWLFWGSLGVLVLTGVGNLGALGPPGPGTPWGRTLGWKLALVFGLAVGSGVRTMAVFHAWVRDAAGGGETGVASVGSEPARAHLAFARRAYALTAWAVVAVVALAEVLAHG